MEPRHRPGVQSVETFARTERELRHQSQSVPSSSSAPQQTVYRDQQGRRVDAVEEQRRKDEARARSKKAVLEAQIEWGKGSVQKQERAESLQELQAIALEPFARTEADPALEKMRKEQIRDGDPMAEYVNKKKRKNEEPGVSDKSRSGKPLYAGPNPTPNRFGLRPGYRWDAIDRGNGFEQRVLKKMNEKSAFRQEEYRWAVADL